MLLVSACSDDVEQKIYEEPITKKKYVVKQMHLDGWTLNSLEGGSSIILSRDGKNVFGTLGGRITIFSENQPEGAVTLSDYDLDTNYESITYRSNGKAVTDIGLDGIQDGVMDYKDVTLFINYKGKMYRFIDTKFDRHIVVDGQKIPVEAKYGIVVPLQNNLHNK